MTLDLDTFLTTVYCTVDELYVAHFGPHKPRRPGHRPELSDSEVLTLVLLAQWQARRSERAFLREVATHWRAYFPRLVSQSAFNRRARDLAPVLAALGPAVAQRVTARWTGVPYEVLDGVPVPLARRCRGLRHKLFTCEAAGLGKGGSDQDWYFGVHLLAAVHPAGVCTGFVLGPADTSERWLAEALFRWRQDPQAPHPHLSQLTPVLGPSHRAGGDRRGPTGRLHGRTAAGAPARGPYVADLGFRGRRWQAHWRATYGAHLLTKADLAVTGPAPYQHALRRTAARVRQAVETVFSWLTDRFGLPFPRARTLSGLLARAGAKVAACNLAIYVNHLTNQPPFAFFDPLAA